MIASEAPGRCECHVKDEMSSYSHHAAFEGYITNKKLPFEPALESLNPKVIIVLRSRMRAFCTDLLIALMNSKNAKS